MLYVCLRPDKQWRLISYPYYAKDARLGDSTGFRRVDINLPLLAKKQYGINMIQGLVSITDEELNDCTEIVPGMHRYTIEWHERVVKRGIELASEVIRIVGWVLTKGDLTEFVSAWRPVPCKKGGIRMTQLSIPYGALGLCKQPRQTMLVWYVEVEEDHIKLDIPRRGTQEQISMAHCDDVAPSSTPSGFSSTYKRVPYAFLADINVGGLGALSDTLIGRVRWADAAVTDKRDIILDEDRYKVQTFGEIWRKLASIRANQAFKHEVKAEKRASGERSYFLRKE